MPETPRRRAIISPQARKQLERLPLDDQRRISRAIDGLREDPMAGDLKKLEARSDEWRLRVGGYRVRFRLDRQLEAAVILRVEARGRAYRD